MRIAYISQYFYPEQFSNNALARSLVDKGHDVDVITCVPNYPEGVFTDGYSNKTRREDDWCGVRIHRAWTIARGQRAIQLIANYLAFVVTGIWTARKVARKHRPDISFVSMPSPVFQALVGIYLKRRFKVPLVYWVQDIWPESATYSLNLRSPVIIKPLTGRSYHGPERRISTYDHAVWCSVRQSQCISQYSSRNVSACHTRHAV